MRGLESPQQRIVIGPALERLYGGIDPQDDAANAERQENNWEEKRQEEKSSSKRRWIARIRAGSHGKRKDQEVAEKRHEKRDDLNNRDCDMEDKRLFPLTRGIGHGVARRQPDDQRRNQRRKEDAEVCDARQHVLVVLLW